MLCNKCGKEIQDNSLFCNYCGNNIKKNLEENIRSKEKEKANVDIKEETSKQEHPKNKNNFVIGIIAIVFLGAIALIYNFSSNPTKSLLNAINESNYEEMKDVYNTKIKGNIEEEKKLAEKLKVEIDIITQNFKSNQISHEDAMETIDGISNLGILKNETKITKKYITDISKSRTSFISANEFEKSGDYINAIDGYNNVNEDDTENHSIAQSKIVELSEEYKKEVLIKSEELTNNRDYRSAISLINDALNILPNDSDFEAKKTTYNQLLQEQIELEKAQEKEKAKSEQLVIIDSTKVVVQSTQYKALYPDMFQVVIKNNSNKTIKSFKVSMLGWDKNGYPLKIQQNFLDNTGSYEFKGFGDNVNVVHGESFGKNVGWNLEEGHNIVITKAVVAEAEFYDGSTWYNPYYQYFLDEFEGKPLEN